MSTRVASENTNSPLFSRIEKKPSYSLETVAIVAGAILMLGCALTPVALHFFHVPGIHLQHYLMFGGGFALSATIALIAIASCLKKRHKETKPNPSKNQISAIGPINVITKGEKKPYLVSIPPELLLHILSFLDIQSLGRIASACKLLKQVQVADALWRPFAIQCNLPNLPQTGFKKIVEAGIYYVYNYQRELESVFNIKLRVVIFNEEGWTNHTSFITLDKIEKVLPRNCFLYCPYWGQTSGRIERQVVLCRHKSGETERFTLVQDKSNWRNWLPEFNAEKTVQLKKILLQYQQVTLDQDMYFDRIKETPAKTSKNTQEIFEQICETKSNNRNIATVIQRFWKSR